jgi:hypothetical protein
MDDVTRPSPEERRRAIRYVMDKFGLDEIEAADFVAMGLGEGDVRFDHILTPEERWEIGLDRGTSSEPIVAAPSPPATRRA